MHTKTMQFKGNIMEIGYSVIFYSEKNDVKLNFKSNIENNIVTLKIENKDFKDKVKVCLDTKACVISGIMVTNGFMPLLYEMNSVDIGGGLYVFENPPVFDVQANGKDVFIRFECSVADDKILVDTIKKTVSYKYDYDRLLIKNKKLSSDVNAVSELYFEIKNSFYWRLMAVPRAITNFLKLSLKRFVPIYRFFSIVKFYLTHNPIKLIIKTHEKPSKLIYKIPLKQRRMETNFNFHKDIKFSVLVPLYNTPKKFLIEMIKSVQNQTYSNWELCLADGSDSEHKYVEEICRKLSAVDNRIKYEKLEKNLGISENTNHCIKMSTGDYIALFDHDDLLHPSALYEVMRAICFENADYVYTDENTFIKYPTQRVFTHYKPDFSPDTLRSNNYICHFSIFSKKLLDSVGYFRSKCDGSQDYDLILRLTEKAKKIVHIPKVLYFWRSHKNSVASSIGAKPYVINAAKQAITDHLKRVGLEGTVENSAVISTYKINYKIYGNPKISIIIPNKDYIDDLDKCINSILRKTTYNNYEIIIVENNSTEQATFEYYEKLKVYKNIKIVIWDDEFNYSAINNFGEKYATGEYILLLNNDVEIITPNWIEEMLMFAQRSDVGGVGIKLYYPDDTIQHGGVILGMGGIAGHAHKNLPSSSYGYVGRASYAQNLSACTAACFMVRKSVYEEVGGLDEGYKVAFNDVDLCMKIRKAGYLIVFTPYAEMYHYESKSRGFEDTPEKVKRFNSEVKRFESKWGEELKKGDPYYNPNLSLLHEDFRFK